MKRLIAVSGIKVEQGLCTVGFKVWTRFNDMELSRGTIEATHNTLYKMLDAAVSVKEFDNENGRIAEINMGNGMFIDVWEVK